MSHDNDFDSDEAETANDLATLDDGIAAAALDRGVAASLNVPDYCDQPASRPIQWRDVLDKHGPDAVKYTGPIHEFIENRYELNMTTLTYRWQGMGKERELIDLAMNEEFRIARSKRHAEKLKNSDYPDSRDPVYLKAVNNLMASHILEQMEKIQDEITSGVEIVVEMLVEPVGRSIRTVPQTVRRALSSGALSRKRRDYMALSQQFYEITGQKKTLVEHEHRGTIQQSIDIAIARREQREREMRATLQNGSNPALPAGAILEGLIDGEGGVVGVEGEIVYNNVNGNALDANDSADDGDG